MGEGVSEWWRGSAVWWGLRRTGSSREVGETPGRLERERKLEQKIEEAAKDDENGEKALPSSAELDGVSDEKQDGNPSHKESEVHPETAYMQGGTTSRPTCAARKHLNGCSKLNTSFNTFHWDWVR